MILKVTSGKELVDTPFWSNFILLRKNQLNLKFCWRKFTYYGKKKSAELPKNNSGGENAACTIDTFVHARLPSAGGTWFQMGRCLLAELMKNAGSLEKTRPSLIQFLTGLSCILVYSSCCFNSKIQDKKCQLTQNSIQNSEKTQISPILPNTR